MRLSELLFEDPAPSGPVPPGMKWNGTMWVPDTTPVKADAPKTDEPKTEPAKKKKKRINPRNMYDSAVARIKYKQSWVRRREQVLGEKYGWKLKWLFRGLGIWVAITETWAITDVLDDMYQKGEIDETELEEGREFAWGLFNTATIAPAVIRLTANALLLTRVLRFLKNALAAVTAVGSLGASIAAAAASEAFFIWLQKWIMSVEGQKWFSTYLYEFIRYFGKPTDAVANTLQQAWNVTQGKGNIDYYDDAKKRREQGGKADGQGGQPDKGPPPPPQSTETWPRHIRYEDRNRIFVGGVKVTDDEGKLIVGVQNALAVQGARAGAKQLKLKDPLEDIPLHPGQPPVKEIF
jgi:hypothetical protein